MELVSLKSFQFANDKVAPCVLKSGQVFVEENREAAINLIREGYAYPSGMPEIIEVEVDVPFHGTEADHRHISGQKDDFLELPRSLALKLMLEGRVHPISDRIWTPRFSAAQKIEKFYTEG